MGLNQLTGVPWHVENMHRKEGDKRRYKGRCRYYEYANNYCNFHERQCSGSAHCDVYYAISDAEFAKKQKHGDNVKKSRKKTSGKTDDIYWY